MAPAAARAIETAGIVVKPHAAGIGRVLGDLVGYLEGRGLRVLFEEAAAPLLGRPGAALAPRAEIAAASDLVVVLGGDGTLLSVAPSAARAGVPILGVNLGNLGFLTEVPAGEMIRTLEALLAGRRDIVSPRMMLSARFRGRDDLCLNDVVINKSAKARMIAIAIAVDGREIAVFRADGLIVATPTGSTGYSLSAGGPILQPAMPAFVLTPICPHALSLRPTVVSSQAEIRVELRMGGEDEEVYLTLDGQRGAPMAAEDVVEIRRAPEELLLVASPERSFFALLREKLRWAG